MYPFFKPTSEINESDLQRLIHEKVSEDRQLDYKRDKYGMNEESKKELSKDISSFANALGGYLIIGMDEANGIPIACDGVDGNPDDEKLRLDSIINTGIKPQIIGIETKAVFLSHTSNYVLIVKIPQSWNPPHMVIKGDDYRFWIRLSSKKERLEVDGLRNLFELSSSAREQIRNFRIERISQIMANETPIPIDQDASALLLHLLPLSSFTTNQQFNLTNLDERLFYTGPDKLGNNNRYNFEGILAYASGGHQYTQVYRNGCIEYLYPSIGRKQGERKEIYAGFESETINKIPKLLSLQKNLEVPMPILIFLTLLKVKDCKLVVSNFADIISETAFIDKDILMTPEVIMENYEDIDIGRMMKDSFNVIWNASGYPQSPNYDEEGNWKPKT